MKNRDSKYSNSLRESVYKDYLSGLKYSDLSDKYKLSITILTSILNKEKVRQLYVNDYHSKLELISLDCERLIINGCNKEQIYEYFCVVKPQLNLSKLYVYRKINIIKRGLHGF